MTRMRPALARRRRMTPTLVALDSALSRFGWIRTVSAMGAQYPDSKGFAPLSLRPDELLEDGNGGLPVDGDLLVTGARPTDSQGIEAVAVQTLDVLRSVGEVVTHAPKPAVIRNDATAVAVDESPDEVRATAADELGLPAEELDWSLMFSVWAVLRKQARPMARVHDNDDAAARLRALHPGSLGTAVAGRRAADAVRPHGNGAMG